jgi:hypothetical protein
MGLSAKWEAGLPKWEAPLPAKWVNNNLGFLKRIRGRVSTVRAAAGAKAISLQLIITIKSHAIKH